MGPNDLLTFIECVKLYYQIFNAFMKECNDRELALKLTDNFFGAILDKTMPKDVNPKSKKGMEIEELLKEITKGGK